MFENEKNKKFYELPVTLENYIASLLHTELAEIKSNMPNIEKTDSLTEESIKIDALVTNPPFHCDGKYDSAFLLKSFKQLKYQGHGVCIVSSGLLSRITTDDILVRQKLLTEMDLHAIILLPENTFPKAKVFSAILSFSNQPPSQNDIIIINLREQNLSKEILNNTVLVIKNPEHKNIGISIQKIKRLDVKPPEYILYPDHYKALQSFNKQHIIFPRNDMADYILQEIDKIFIEKFPDATEMINGETIAYPEGKRPGKDLFLLKNGQELPKDHKNKIGPYPLYQGKGICGTTDICNVESPLPTLIINRVGSYCGRIYYTEKPCFVQTNSMFLAQYDQKFDPIFLFFLFRAANFNRWKYGSAIPSIRQDIIYNTAFITPSLEIQKEFANKTYPKMKQVLDIWDELTYITQEVLF